MVSEPAAAPLPLSRPTPVEGLPDKGLRVEVVADSRERDELARLNGLLDVRDLRASLWLRPEPRGGVWVTGELRASITQTCVISVDPFDADLIEPVDVHFLPELALDAYRAARVKQLPDPSDPVVDVDEPDPLIGGQIDLGALTAELFSLGLDPFPKKPGVTFAEPAPHDPAGASPFAVLKGLKGDKP